MPYKDREQRLQYGKMYMKKRRGTMPDPIIPSVIPEAPHQLKWRHIHLLVSS